MPITPEAHCCRGRRADRPEFSRRRRAAVLVLLLRSQAIHQSAGTASPNGLALFRMFRAETWYRGHDVASERPGRNPHRPVDLISRRWSVEIKDLGSWNQIHLQICKTNISVGRFNLDSFRSNGNRAPVFFPKIIAWMGQRGEKKDWLLSQECAEEKDVQCAC